MTAGSTALALPYGRDAHALRRLAAMDVHALMAPTRDQMPVRATATVLAVAPGRDHELVGTAHAIVVRVHPTDDSAAFEARTSVLASTLVPQVGAEIAVSFRLDSAHDVVVVGPVG